MTEQGIQKGIITYLSNDGWLVFKTVKVTPNGFPDVMAFRRGETILIEVKTPQGRTSAIQKEQHRRLREQGIPVLVATSISEVKSGLTLLNR